MELQNSVNYSNYISINELIKIFDKKYELFEDNNNLRPYNLMCKDEQFLKVNQNWV